MAHIQKRFLVRLDFQEERAISSWAQNSREEFWSIGAETEEKKGAFFRGKEGHALPD